MFLLINIATQALCAQLWRMGGSDKYPAWYRDVCIPIILGWSAGWQTMNFFVGFFSIGAYNIIRIGYGAYDPEHDDKSSILAKITHDRKGHFNRAIAGILYGLIGGLPKTIYTHHYKIYFIYALAIGFVSFICSILKAKDVVIERVIGGTVAGEVYF